MPGAIPGQILVAEHAGVHVIKLLGDVRLTLCMSFDQFIESMFQRDDFVSILFDLTEAQAIDSTTLGLMAKFSIFARELREVTPLIVSTNPSINRLLESMTFAEIFDIMHEMPSGLANELQQATQQLPDSPLAEGDAKAKVIEAHKILMDMNEANHETFKDLVKVLEDDNLSGG